ncbi:unnamed protein product [Strongylus vulgaris]|uniref:Uncharacterized protein n=1 Tax=Strongylus vulgaris TaxID=40348 RepID=A0A3P7ITG5_STRVU|nr:unnamed protein product [Strongylus vulgaris]
MNEREKLKNKIWEMESNHQRAEADFAAMQESQGQFVELLTKKVEQLKKEKLDWLNEKDSYEAQIKKFKQETCTVAEEANYQTSVSQAQIDELTYRV